LSRITTEVFNYDIVSLDRRIKALEDCPQPEPTNAAEDLRRDICEIRVSANENEQYSRRQNLRIKGLTVAPEAVAGKKLFTFAGAVFISETLQYKTLTLRIRLLLALLSRPPVPQRLLLDTLGGLILSFWFASTKGNTGTLS